MDAVRIARGNSCCARPDLVLRTGISIAHRFVNKSFGLIV